VRDADEGYMAGIRFTIARGSAVVAEGVATGSQSAVCTSGLEPGSYQVAQILPDALEMTTAGNTLIDVAQGQEIGLEFGSRIRQVQPEAEAPAATVAVAQVESGDASTNGADAPVVDASDTVASVNNGTSAGSGDGLGLIEMVIIAVMVIAVILLGAVVYLLLRQQR
jgi:hypothetical protein